MTAEKRPTGFACSKCGARHEFSDYLYAHWQERIIHTCECGAVHELLRGVAVFRRQGKRVKEKF